MRGVWTVLCALAAFGAAHAKTLVYCSEGSPENFNPQINTTGTTFDATELFSNRLVEFKLGGTEMEPGLAESWDISPDGLTYTFHLRHGVKFQSNKLFKPSRDFNADDIIFSFERQWKDANPYHMVSGGAYDYFNDMNFPKLLKAIDKVDEYTVRFTLTEAQAPFLSDLAMEFTSIQSKEYADQLLAAGHPEQIDQQPIGTGPFQFVEYQKDATIRYKRFADFWGPKPKIDSLVFAITKDAATRLAKLQANECQIMPYPAPADLPTIRANPDLKLLDQPGLNIGYLAFNTEKKPFGDKRVRQAITMAIDRKAILDAVFQGSGAPAKNLIPPTIAWAWDPATPDYVYDPAAAKTLLARAGFPNGFETELWAMPVQRPYNPDAHRTAELIQADLAKIGITAKIVSYEWGEYRKRAQAGEAPMAQLGWTGDNGDPDNFFQPLASCTAARPGGGNIAKWCNQEFQKRIDLAATISDQPQRARLYREAQAIMHEEDPFYLIAHSVVFMPMRANVIGYQMSPFGRHQFTEVDLK